MNAADNDTMDRLAWIQGHSVKTYNASTIAQSRQRKFRYAKRRNLLEKMESKPDVLKLPDHIVQHQV